MSQSVGVYIQIKRVEDTMYRSIKSVMAQTYENMHVYFDVSEVTKPLIEKIVSGDKRFSFLEINSGLGFSDIIKEIAMQNDFFAVIDGDDWIDPTYFEKLIEFAEKNKLDVACCGYDFVKDDGQVVGSRSHKEIVYESRKNFLENLTYEYGYFRTLWAKIWKSDLLKKIDTVPTSEKYGGYGGDTMECFCFLAEAERVGISDETAYHYLQSSVSNSRIIKEGRLDADEAVYEYVENVLKDNGMNTKWNEMFLQVIYAHAIKDTLKLISEVNLDEKIRTDYFRRVVCNPRTVNFLNLEMENKINYEIGDGGKSKAAVIYGSIVFHYLSNHVELLSGEGKNYYDIFQILFPEYCAYISYELFELIIRNKRIAQVCVEREITLLQNKLIDLLQASTKSDIDLICGFLYKTSSNPIIKWLAQNPDFICSYADIAVLTLYEKYDKVSEECINKIDNSAYKESLIELWINAAAISEDVENFIKGKEYKINYLREIGNEQEAQREIDELAEIGVVYEGD